jgi:hypothetical protein
MNSTDIRLCTPGDAAKGQRMTNRLNYLQDEWLTLARAPLTAMTAVMGAGQTSAVQIAQELVAIRQAIRSTREATGAAELIQALIVETEAQAAEHFQRESEILQFAGVQDRALVACREASAILTTKAPPAEAAEYRHWVLWLARAVAQGASEGQGAVSPVSPEEESLLTRLGAALAKEPSMP